MECLTSLAYFKQQENNEFQFYLSGIFFLTFASVLLYYKNDESPLACKICSLKKVSFKVKSPLYNIRFMNIATYFQRCRVRLCVQA